MVIRSIKIVVLLFGAIVTFYLFDMLPSFLGYFLYIIYTDSIIFLRFIWQWKLGTQRRSMNCVIDTPLLVFWMSKVYSIFQNH